MVAQKCTHVALGLTTCAARMMKHSVPIVAVPEMLGHSSVSMTLDIYSHSFPDAERNATSVLDQLMPRSATDGTAAAR
jgi:integrase